MDEFWLKFDGRSFEKLAYDYACWREPQLDWVQTKPTWDGGKDGVAKKKDKGIDKYVWYEAKHTIHYNHAIPLSKIASTVLVGSNRNNILEKVIIITNAHFTTNTINEIKTVLGEKVSFVFGDELSVWLSKKSQKKIRIDYGLGEIQKEIKPKYYLFAQPLVIEPTSLFNSVSTASAVLTVGKKYDLVYIFYINPDKYNDFDFEIKNTPDFIKIESDNNLSFSPGINYVKTPFTPICTGIFDLPILSLIDKVSEDIIDIKFESKITINPDTDFFIDVKSQFQCLFDLKSDFKESLNYEATHLVGIVGNKGCGKSYVIQDFIKEHSDNAEFLYVKFVKNYDYENSLLLIRIIVFIVFGKFFSSNSIEGEDINQLEEISEYNKYYTKYLGYLDDENNLLKNVDSLITRNLKIIPNTNNNQKKIIVIDDLQFLGDVSSKLLLRILKDLFDSGHNIFILYAQRNISLENIELEEYLTTYAARQPKNIYISEDDVLDEFSKFSINNIPESLSKKIQSNIFIFKEFISLLNESDDILDVLNSKTIRSFLKNQDIQDIGYRYLASEEKEITDLVYFNNNGVDASYLYDNYSGNTINSLIQKNIVSYDPSKKAFVPYHDIFLESLGKILDFNKDHVYDYAVYQKGKGNIVAYLSSIGIFHDKLISNLDFLIQKIEEYHNEQNFFNIHYVLKRLFTNTKINSVMSKYNKALLLYYYAYATFNVGESNGLLIFEEAQKTLEDKPTIEDKRLGNIILSEITNCEYWNLNFKTVEQNYKLIHSYFYSLNEKNENDWKAFLGIANRYINTLLFMDKTEDAKKTYNDLLHTCGGNEILKTWSVSLNYSFLNIESNPNGALNTLLALNQVCDTLPVKSKFIIKTHFHKISCILKDGDMTDFENTIRWGAENNLNYNSGISKLQLAICYAIKKDFIETETILNSIINIRDFPTLAKGIYYNLQALVYLSSQNFTEATICIEKQQECFKDFGDSYINKIKANMALINRRPNKFDVRYKLTRRNTKTLFYIESRF